MESNAEIERLGRYVVHETLGVGAFAVVYRGFDEELGRDVAVKVLRSVHLTSSNAFEAFLDEARILAQLDHPGIVPIYDIGRMENGRAYLITKLIDGTDLKTRLKQGRLPRADGVEIAACIAEALDHAHRHGLIHRDVKPGNILLTAAGHAMLVDFGLALREENIGRGSGIVGTVRYMSPEQARGEGHRVDARSDVYSLGVVLFELLTGRLPFLCESREEMLQMIRSADVPPPRHFDDSISPELERICLKATARRSLDRYATAAAMAADLRQWQQEVARAAVEPRSSGSNVLPAVPAAPAPVVPHGLRAFSAEDADFFLDLLPGPRSREGLPESLQFWKTRLESVDPELAFRVGVLSGPSGSGKSSLVKAGLLPRLEPRVHTRYVEASAEETEARLLQSLRRGCPALPPDLGLVGALAWFRRGTALATGQKVVIVLDQFEQWLHAHHKDQGQELVDSLRQCDGVHVQCLILVRDDFWAAAHRFMQDLEVPLLEGQNTALVDRFSLSHARGVLAKFGRGYGRLATAADEATQRRADQFLNEAVAGLAEDGKVVPVRLGVFAEIFKERDWNLKTLREVGGSEGIGTTFLEDAFGDAAPASRRAHAAAARSVLHALLPQPGSDLRGGERSTETLLEASGYGRQPEKFAELMRQLDSELRLVTPAAPDAESAKAAGSSYQLTHDFLVPTLREWLARKQRETRRGRAELRLAESANLWTAVRGVGQLPTWWDWLRIRLYTSSRSWNDRERTMMRAANRFHATRTGVAVALLLLGVAGTVWLRMQAQDLEAERRADRMVAVLQEPRASRLPEITAEALRDPRWTEPRLRALIADPASNDEERLLARMVLLSLDPSQVEPLFQGLPTASAPVVVELREALLPYKGELIPRLWKQAEDASMGDHARFRAACMLADYDAGGVRWQQLGPYAAHQLVLQNTGSVGTWIEAFRPVRGALLPHLITIYHLHERPSQDPAVLLHRARTAATVVDALAAYAADDPATLADLLLDANAWQFRRLWPVFARHARAHQLLDDVLARTPPANATELERNRLARQQARAYLGLLCLGRDDHVWPQLRPDADPRLRSYLIQVLGSYRECAPILLRRCETDIAVRDAVLLILGEQGRLDALPAPQRQAFVDRVFTWYRDDPNPGRHAAAEWLLTQWGYGERLAAARRTLPDFADRGVRRWFVNGQEQTFVLIEGPVEFEMGSPESERDRDPDEGPHPVRIGRAFALAARETTIAEFLRFRKDHAFNRRIAPEADDPMIGLSWYEAVAYCRWLSEQEKVPEDQMCYPPLEQIKPGMKLPADFLERTGYRLPTEAEWEYACRAGTTTSRFYGSSDELLARFAWYSANSRGLVHPGGQLRPNEFGLFDMYGNAWEWCQDAYHPLRPGTEVRKDDAFLGDANTINRVQRGGAADMIAARLRSSARRWKLATEEFYHNTGLRPARTWHAEKSR